MVIKAIIIIQAVLFNLWFDKPPVPRKLKNMLGIQPRNSLLHLECQTNRISKTNLIGLLMEYGKRDLQNEFNY